jgi:hypothetical protein
VSNRLQAPVHLGALVEEHLADAHVAPVRDLRRGEHRVRLRVQLLARHLPWAQSESPEWPANGRQALLAAQLRARTREGD